MIYDPHWDNPDDDYDRPIDLFVNNKRMPIQPGITMVRTDSIDIEETIEFPRSSPMLFAEVYPDVCMIAWRSAVYKHETRIIRSRRTPRR